MGATVWSEKHGLEDSRDHVMSEGYTQSSPAWVVAGLRLGDRQVRGDHPEKSQDQVGQGERHNLCGILGPKSMGTVVQKVVQKGLRNRVPE